MSDTFDPAVIAALTALTTVGDPAAPLWITQTIINTPDPNAVTPPVGISNITYRKIHRDEAGQAWSPMAPDKALAIVNVLGRAANKLTPDQTAAAVALFGSATADQRAALAQIAMLAFLKVEFAARNLQ